MCLTYHYSWPFCSHKEEMGREPCTPFSPVIGGQPDKAENHVTSSFDLGYPDWPCPFCQNLIEKNGQREKSTEAETIEIKNNQAWNEKPGESAWPGLPNRVIGHGGGAQIHGHNMLPYNDRAIGFSAPIQRAYSQVVEYDMVDLPYRRRLCLDLPPQPGYWPGPQRAPNVPWRSKQYGPAANAQSRLLGGYANHSPVRAQLATHRRSAVFNRAGVFNTPAHHSPLIPTGQRLIAHPLVQIQQQHTVPPSIRTAQQPSSSYQP